MNEPRKSMTDKELDQLFAQARQLRPETGRAEFAFETRLMAGLGEERDSIGLLGWRLAPWFAAVVLAFGLLSWGQLSDPAAPVPDSFADWILVQMFFAT